MSNANEWDKWNEAIIEGFRANDGKVGGSLADKPLVLLHTSGARSGLPRLNPLTYVANGERLVVIASKAGAPNNPDWYYNIIADPEVSVEVGTKQFQARATIVPEPERTKLYELITKVHPINAEYQRKTTRIIPVIVLTRMP